MALFLWFTGRHAQRTLLKRRLHQWRLKECCRRKIIPQWSQRGDKTCLTPSLLGCISCWKTMSSLFLSLTYGKHHERKEFIKVYEKCDCVNNANWVVLQPFNTLCSKIINAADFISKAKWFTHSPAGAGLAVCHNQCCHQCLESPSVRSCGCSALWPDTASRAWTLTCS